MATVPAKQSTERSDVAERMPVIDVDTHCGYPPAPDALNRYLPKRWAQWLTRFGIRSMASTLHVPRARQFAHRLDAVPPTGMPGSDPEFAREQLLDAFGMSAAFLNLLPSGVGGNEPHGLAVAMATATNEHVRDNWLEADPRWYGSITVPIEQPSEAAQEIARCAEEHPRWRQVMISSKIERPFGNPRYWPIIEAAAHYDLPIAFHVGNTRANTDTGSGPVNHYYESHVSIAYGGYSIVPSLIFEGVFERFPALKIVLVELGWSWVAPFAWRLDSAYRVMGDEVSHLERKPSEYLAQHFWLTTQPIDEPERPEWIHGLYTQAEQAGFGDRLLFSSDYPHWDFDSPVDALPLTLSRSVRAKILGENASALYGIPLESSETQRAGPPDAGGL